MTFVERTNQDRKTETLYNQEILEQAILHRNQRHFNQCAGTPIAVGKQQELEWATDSALSDSILNENIDPASITNNHLVQQVLYQCKHRRAVILHVQYDTIHWIFPSRKRGTISLSPCFRCCLTHEL